MQKFASAKGKRRDAIAEKQSSESYSVIVSTSKQQT
jgi:hypothetical protein